MLEDQRRARKIQRTACDEPFGREPLGRELRVERLRAERLSRDENRKQMTEDKKQTVSVFCHLTTVICYLTPKIKPSYVNSLLDAIRF
jgi:hypothetical protein